MQKISAAFELKAAYDVLFTRDVFSPGNRELVSMLSKESRAPVKTFWVLDGGMLVKHPNLTERIYNYSKMHATQLEPVSEQQILVLPGGEVTKNNPHHIDQILEKLHELKIDRHSFIISVGGGAMIDCVGYCASVAHRGIRHIRVPTTVLAQNDSGIGVKNGMNLYNKKNFLGSFEIPYGVINDISFIRTLSDRDIRSGIAEAIKVALIKDADFFDWLETHSNELKNRREPILVEMIFRCAKLHVDHICNGGDPFEKGSSRPLDFGHWSAHKLESLSEYSIRHGEAVAIGIALDTLYSGHIGLLDRVSVQRILKLLLNLGYDLQPKELQNTSDILNGLSEFREHLGGELTLILLKAIGVTVVMHEMNHALMTTVIHELNEY